MTTSPKEVWIQYVASQDQSLPDDVTAAMRLPFGGFTWLLSEEWSFDGQVPALGDRPRIYRNNYSQGGDDMQSRPGDWVVEAVELYPSSKQIQMFAGSSHLTTYDAIAVCTCRFAPVPIDEQAWRNVPRAAAIPALQPA